MPSPDRSSPASRPDDTVLALQARVETLYLQHQALEQQLRALRALHPVMAVRPPPPSWPLRLALRLLPRLRRRQQAGMIRASGLFDRNWYLATYPDVATSGIDPVLHFLHHGASERRDPGPHFDTGHYLRMYPDIAGNGMNPLLHYLVAGWAEGRSIRPGMAHGTGHESGQGAGP
jgi:hypothetical protein